MLKLCTLASGSSGNSIYIESERTKILIDAGISARQLSSRLALIGVNPNELSGILVTHEHSDHIKGLRVFANKYSVPVYSTAETWYYLENENIAACLQRNIHNDGYFEVGDIEITSYPIPHDAIDPVGYNISNKNSTLSVVTDLGHVPPYLRDKLKESSLVFVEANHDIETLNRGKYPASLKRRILGDRGHLSNDSAAEIITDLAGRKTDQIVLGHLSRNNNTPELAVTAVENRLRKAGCRIGFDLSIYCCPHGKMGDLMTIL